MQSFGDGFYINDRHFIKIYVFHIPVASLELLNSLGVLILTPIAAKALYPRLAKCGVHLSQLQRIGVGMLITTASMLCAGSDCLCDKR